MLHLGRGDDALDLGLHRRQRLGANAAMHARLQFDAAIGVGTVIDPQVVTRQGEGAVLQHGPGLAPCLQRVARVKLAPARLGKAGLSGGAQRDHDVGVRLVGPHLLMTLAVADDQEMRPLAGRHRFARADLDALPSQRHEPRDLGSIGRLGGIERAAMLVERVVSEQAVLPGHRRAAEVFDQRHLFGPAEFDRQRHLDLAHQLRRVDAHRLAVLVQHRAQHPIGAARLEHLHERPGLGLDPVPQGLGGRVHPGRGRGPGRQLRHPGGTVLGDDDPAGEHTALLPVVVDHAGALVRHPRAMAIGGSRHGAAPGGAADGAGGEVVVGHGRGLYRNQKHFSTEKCISAPSAKCLGTGPAPPPWVCTANRAAQDELWPERKGGLSAQLQGRSSPGRHPRHGTEPAPCTCPPRKQIGNRSTPPATPRKNWPEREGEAWPFALNSTPSATAPGCLTYRRRPTPGTESASSTRVAGSLTAPRQRPNQLVVALGIAPNHASHTRAAGLPIALRQRLSPARRCPRSPQPPPGPRTASLLPGLTASPASSVFTV